MSGELEQLAYDLATEALKQQDSTLDELRTRTGTLLAAASLVASFLGARAVDRTGLDWLNVLALVAFTSSALLSVYVLFPRKRIQRSLSGPIVYEHFTESDVDLAEAHRQLAYWIQDAYSANQVFVNRLFFAKGYSPRSTRMRVHGVCGTLRAEAGRWTGLSEELHRVHRVVSQRG
jgi:hypothetical protein